MAGGRIDYDALMELKDMLEDEFAELVDTFVRDTSLKLETLSQLSPVSESEEIRKVAHSLKGASINLGLMALGEHCRSLELQAKDNAIADYPQHLSQIQGEITYVLDELQGLV